MNLRRIDYSLLDRSPVPSHQFLKDHAGNDDDIRRVVDIAEKAQTALDNPDAAALSDLNDRFDSLASQLNDHQLKTLHLMNWCLTAEYQGFHGLSDVILRDLKMMLPSIPTRAIRNGILLTEIVVLSGRSLGKAHDKMNALLDNTPARYPRRRIYGLFSVGLHASAGCCIQVADLVLELSEFQDCAEELARLKIVDDFNNGRHSDSPDHSEDVRRSWPLVIRLFPGFHRPDWVPPHREGQAFQKVLDNTVRHLKSRRPQEALRELDKLEILATPPTLGSFIDSVRRRAILASSPPALARIVTERSPPESPVELMWNRCRMAIMEGDRKSAGNLFRDLLHLSGELKASTRLESEIQMSAELDALDLHRLHASRLGSGSPSRASHPTPPHEVAALHGTSSAIDKLRRDIRSLAKSDHTVLVSGESGSGKSLVTKLIHGSGPRSGRDLVVVDCSQFTTGLFTAELSGHRKGAFTGAVRASKGILRNAGRGTVVLDRVDVLAPEQQAVLLRILDSRCVRPLGDVREFRVSCRFLATLQGDPQQLMAEGKLRKDLYYRMSASHLRCPSLRRRTGDLPELVNVKLETLFAPDPPPRISDILMELFRSYHWPGNVRELENVLEALVRLNPDAGNLDVGHLDITTRRLLLKDTPEPDGTGRDDRRHWRRQRILAIFMAQRSTTIKDVSAQFNVTQRTIASDFSALVNAGKIRKRRGSHSYEII